MWSSCPGFEARLPAEVCDPASFRRWADAEASAARDKTGSGGNITLPFARGMSSGLMRWRASTRRSSQLPADRVRGLISSNAPLSMRSSRERTTTGSRAAGAADCARPVHVRAGVWLVPGSAGSEQAWLLKALPKCSGLRSNLSRRSPNCARGYGGSRFRHRGSGDGPERDAAHRARDRGFSEGVGDDGGPIIPPTASGSERSRRQRARFGT